MNNFEKIFSRKFVRGLEIYGLVFLLLVSSGILLLNGYLKAYEKSIPRNAAEQYISSVSAEDIMKGSMSIIEQIDKNIQPEEEAKAVINSLASGDISFVTNMEKSAENTQSYVLLIDRQQIGSCTVTANDDNSFGFKGWEVADVSFDLSQLLGEGRSITVPEGFAVFANGHPLDESYITQRDIGFDLFEEFYGSYSFPHKVTYTVENYIGDMELTVSNEAGADVTAEAKADWEGCLDNCSAEDAERLNAFLNEFISRYVRYSSSNKDTMSENFDHLCKLLVKNGALQRRLAIAQVGLKFSQNTSDKLAEVNAHHIVRSGEGKYLCSATYYVDTKGKDGVIQTTNNLKIIVTEKNGSLYTEAMVSY